MEVTAAGIPQSHGKAAAVLERLLNNKIFPHGGANHPQFLNAKVDIGIGLKPQTADAAQQEVLRITVAEHHADTIPAEMRDQVMKTFAETALAEAPQIEVCKAPEDHGKMAFEFILPPGKANELVEKLASLGPDRPVVQSTVPDLHFASVDSVKLVGVSSPDILPHLADSLKPAPGQNVDLMLVPFAQQLIQHIEEAHRAVQEATRIAAETQNPNGFAERVSAKDAAPPAKLPGGPC